MRHIIAPLLGAGAWPLYASWFAQRELPVPLLPDAGFAYALELELEPRRRVTVPLAGVCVYLTKAQGALVEHFATNPDPMPRVVAVARARYSFAYLTAAVRTYCCGAGKYPFLLTRHKGIRKALLREGWTLNPSGEFAHTPLLETPASARLGRQQFSSSRATPRATVRDVGALEDVDNIDAEDFDII